MNTAKKLEPVELEMTGQEYLTFSLGSEDYGVDILRVPGDSGLGACHAYSGMHRTMSKVCSTCVDPSCRSSICAQSAGP